MQKTMDKNIKIDLNSKEDLVEKYNIDKVSSGLIDYIIKEAEVMKSKEKIKIIVNKKCNIDGDCEKLIKDGLREEYKRSLNQYHQNNKKQLFFLALGTLILFLATLMQDSLWKQILIITGWVPIWEMVEVELFPDVYGRRKRRIIKKLLESEVIEKILD